jgi:hypothetical protein
MESTEITTSSESSVKSYTIATALPSDLEKLGIMGHLFAESYGANLMNFKTHIFKEKMAGFMTNKTGIVLCLHEEFELKGAIAGVLYENVFDGELCASELFWYVWPGARKGSGTALLHAFEEWALGRGATRVTMAHMLHNMPERLGAFYERNGYTPFEQHFVKRL